MPLSLDCEIARCMVESVEVLKPLKVYILHDKHNEKLVIKHEVGTVTTGSIEMADHIMTTIDPNARVVPLSQSELNELAHIEGIQKLLWNNRIRGAFGDIDDLCLEVPDPGVEDLLDSLNDPTGTWLKMNFVYGVHDLAGAFKDRAENDKSGLKDLKGILKSNGGLEKLGQVVAADMFIGNTDRFMPESAHTHRAGDLGVDLKVLWNVGNVFFSKTNGKAEIRALDYVDPNNPFKEINNSLADQELGGPWSGKILADKAKLRQFAQDIADDLEKIISPHGKYFKKLPSDAAWRIEIGMIEGRRKIVDKLMAAKPLTKGISDRLQALNVPL